MSEDADRRCRIDIRFGAAMTDPRRGIVDPASGQPQQRRPAKRALRICVRGLAVIGLVDVLGRLALIPLTGTIFGFAVTTPMELKVDSVVASPDGRFKAVVYSEEGSGLDPHCTVIVSVVAASASIATAWAFQHRVYTADCMRDAEPECITAVETDRSSVRDYLKIKGDARRAWSVSRSAMDGAVIVSFADDAQSEFGQVERR